MFPPNMHHVCTAEEKMHELRTKFHSGHPAHAKKNPHHKNNPNNKKKAAVC